CRSASGWYWSWIRRLERCQRTGPTGRSCSTRNQTRCRVTTRCQDSIWRSTRWCNRAVSLDRHKKLIARKRDPRPGLLLEVAEDRAALGGSSMHGHDIHTEVAQQAHGRLGGQPVQRRHSLHESLWNAAAETVQNAG